MKPDLQFTILCDDLRIENNGKFILIGLFDNIAAARLPVIHKKFCVVNRWGKGEGEFTDQTRIVCAYTNQAVAESKPVTFKLETMDMLHNVVSQFQNVSFPEEGKYWVEVHLNGELVRSFNFYVRKIAAPKAP
ncbi:MAG: hypothetical protein HQL11_02995 [Candidatus Omnitrophica bacterium]|nr:hypothetical protein [Candidatus Omnitrophota bacterium]